MYLLLFLYCVPFIILTVLLEAEWFGFATFELVAFAGLMGWLHRHDLLPFAKDHVWDLLIYGTLYIVLGIVWSYAKWARVSYNFRSDFREAKIKFCALQDPPLDAKQPIPVSMMTDFTSHFGYQFRQRPQALQNKSRIIAWMSFWPCSMIGFVLNDPIRRLFTALFNLLRSSYQRMSDHIINDVEFTDRSSEVNEQAAAVRATRLNQDR